MKHMARYSWVNAINVGGIQYLHEPRQHIELCSNVCKDNYSLSENTVSPTSVISKGFFQSEVQKALQNSQIEKAFEIVSNISRPQRENSIASLTQKLKK